MHSIISRRCAAFVGLSAGLACVFPAFAQDLCTSFNNVIVRDVDASQTTARTDSGNTVAGPNDVIVARFRTGSGTSTSLGTVTAAETPPAGPSARIGALSTTMCDFSAGLGPFAVASGNTVTVPFSVGPNGSGYPALQPNTTYYFNIEEAQGSSCASSGNCNMYIQVQIPHGLTLQSLPAAANVAATSGSGQSTTVATAFAQPLVALVTDVNGNPVPNATVTWIAPTSSAGATFTPPGTSVTDYRGLASTIATANGIAGSYTVLAQVGGVSGTYVFTNVASTASACGGDISTIAGLVEQYYMSILRRPSDAPGKAFWISEAERLCSLGADPKEAFFLLANVFFNTPEYTAFNRDDNGFVTDLYVTFFGRSPDTSGLSYWVGQLAAGLPRNVVMSSFLFSPEFTTTMNGVFPGRTARAETYLVLNLYGGLFKRLADSSGYLHWDQQYRAAECNANPASVVTATIDTMSAQFLSTPEYIGRATTNSQYMQDLYYALLQRGGDLAGFNFWVAQLDSGVLTRDQVRQRFLQSPEMQTQAAAIAAQGC
jgi:uncharacterized protein DUF4214/Big-like domain-containing protein